MSASKLPLPAHRRLILIGNILEGPKDGNCIKCILFTKCCPGINQQTGNLFRERKKLSKLSCFIPKIQKENTQPKKRVHELANYFINDKSWIQDN